VLSLALAPVAVVVEEEAASAPTTAAAVELVGVVEGVRVGVGEVLLGGIGMGWGGGGGKEGTVEVDAARGGDPEAAMERGMVGVGSTDTEALPPLGVDKCQGGVGVGRAEVVGGTGVALPPPHLGEEGEGGGEVVGTGTTTTVRVTEAAAEYTSSPGWDTMTVQFPGANRVALAEVLLALALVLLLLLPLPSFPPHTRSSQAGVGGMEGAL
jgi:hypothetical protein